LKKIFVGNLPFDSSEGELQDFFSQHGKVHKVQLVTDPTSGKPRGYAFLSVEESDAEKVISSLDASDFHGRTLRVKLAEERTFKNIPAKKPDSD